jgi:hypothetical protein
MSWSTSNPPCQKTDLATSIPASSRISICPAPEDRTHYIKRRAPEQARDSDLARPMPQQRVDVWPGQEMGHTSDGCLGNSALSRTRVPPFSAQQSAKAWSSSSSER